MSTGALFTAGLLAVWGIGLLVFAVWREYSRQRNLEAQLEIREMFEPPWLQPHHIVEIVNRTRSSDETDGA